MGAFRKNNFHIKPLIIAAGAFLLLSLVAYQYTSFKKGLWEKDVRANLLEILMGKKSSLEQALYSRIFYTRGVAAFVSLKPDISNKEFTQLASEYIKGDTVIATMSISRDGIINMVYPLEGHEEALGLNLLEHPKRRAIVEKTIETHKTFVAGPVELMEGGIAFISYTPVFDKTTPGEERFWGVTDIVIMRDALLREAGLVESDNSFRYVLRGYDGLGVQGRVFWGDSSVLDMDPVSISIELPTGQWVLSSTPLDGWAAYLDQDMTLQWVIIVGVIIISILVYFLARTVTGIQKREKELRAIFISIDSLILEIGADGRYKKIPPTNEDLLYQPKEQLLGKHITDVFEPEIAGRFLQAIDNCLRTRQVMSIDYQLPIKGQEKWFRTRITYKDPESVIFNCVDITKRKLQEEELLKSKERLARMNDMKDRLFSIIAHDLRGPAGSLNGLITVMYEEPEKIAKTGSQDLLKKMKLSSDNLYRILDNLLHWAKSQLDQASVHLQTISLDQIYEPVISETKLEAEDKGITIVNKVNNELLVNADLDLSQIIYRNLLMNAIKYSYPNTEITLSSSSILNEDGKEQLALCVSDQGLGISQEELETLFDGDRSISKAGTENEKGSGLGLVLSREFAERMGGEIRAESVVGKGSRFCLILSVSS